MEVNGCDVSIELVGFLNQCATVQVSGMEVLYFGKLLVFLTYGLIL